SFGSHSACSFFVRVRRIVTALNGHPSHRRDISCTRAQRGRCQRWLHGPRVAAPPPIEDTSMTNAPNHMNRHPITKAPGSHPVGVGLGGVGGAAAGAGIGALFGPIGMLVGGAVGTLAGASAGKGIAESIDPTGETEYWRDEYSNRSYANADYNYDNDYA